MPSPSQIPPKILIEWVWGRTQTDICSVKQPTSSFWSRCAEKPSSKNPELQVFFTISKMVGSWGKFIHSFIHSFLSSTYSGPPSLIFHF